mgnify:CR=1 FL=1
MDFLTGSRFSGIKRFENKLWLSSPTMHGDEQKWVDDAITTNWVSTVGANINEVEKQIAEYVGVKYAVALSAGTAALHLATKLAGEKLYGQARPNEGTLSGHKVFCSDVTFDASINPVAYEDGEAVFIDTEYDTWNMCPKALERAFEIYPDVRLIVVANLYGTPAKMRKIREIANSHNAIIIEDAAESFGAFYEGRPTGNGMYSDYACISFNGNKIITGSSGGMLLTDSIDVANKVRKWSTQSREPFPWYQHEEIGYNYRMSNICAGIGRGQMKVLADRVEKKRAIYQCYKEKLAGLPLLLQPVADNTDPNCWLTALLLEDGCGIAPMEIIEMLQKNDIESRPLWKPMHAQPVFAEAAYVMAGDESVSEDLFRRGLCLPSDTKMKMKDVDRVCDGIRSMF